MKERVEQVRQQRSTAARGRDRRLIPTVGIVGYTNAGKSTLLNSLVGSEVAQGRGQAVRDARPDVAPGQARRRPDGDRHRHGRLHPQAAAPARRRVPGDARGGQPGRRPHRGRRRLGSAPARAPGHGPDRPRRAGRRATSRGSWRSTRRTSSRRRRGTATRRRRRSRGRVLVSALTGFGLDTLRAEMAALLASLWVDVDVRVPYTAGELLARVRERGHGRARLRRPGRPRPRPGGAGAGGRAHLDGRTMGRVAPRRREQRRRADADRVTDWLRRAGRGRSPHD